MNAKNELKELLEARGLPTTLATYTHTQGVAGLWTSTVEVRIPGREPVHGVGTATRKTEADIAASADVLPKLTEASEADTAHWALIIAEAQAGDALIKLAAYLGGGSPEERSVWLQDHESDVALARLFDRWYEEGAPELISYGSGLGTKYKATLVEAIIWRRFGARMLAANALVVSGELRSTVG